MRRIGAEVGCSPMAMYRHYASKEDLLLSICEETFDQMLAAVDRMVYRAGTPLERLRSSMRTLIDFHLSHPNHFRVTFMTEMPSDLAVQRKVAMAQRALDRLRSRVLECAQAKNLNIDVENASQIIRVGVHGFVSVLITKACLVGDPERLKQDLILTLTKQFE
jgi:AcrR family transcriptional regulator